MRIEDYLQKHNLKLFVRRPATSVAAPWLPAILTDCPKPEKGQFHSFEIYANEARDHFVSVNRSRQEFRIFLCEIVAVVSEWNSTNHDYVHSA